MKKIKILSITILFILTLSCYAGILRKDIVSAHLDYYSLRLTEKKAENKLKEEHIFAKKKYQEKSIRKSQQRKEKIIKLLNDIRKDILIKMDLENIYNDNIYKTKDNRQDAWINKVNLALKYKPKYIIKKGHTSLSLDINGGPDTHLTKKNTFIKGKGNFNTFLTHNREKFSWRINFGLGKDYTVATDLKTGAIIEESLVDYWRRLYGLALTMDFSRLPTELSYIHQEDLYKEPYKKSNLLKDSFSLTNYFRLLPKTSFLTSFDYEIADYPKKIDSKIVSYTLWSGVKGKISPKISGLIKLGYRIEDPDSNVDTNTQTVNLNLDYKMFSRLSHNIDISRNVETTSYEDEFWAKTLQFRLSSIYLPAFNKKLRFSSNIGFKNFRYSSDRHDKLYEFGLGAGYFFTDKLTMSATYDFEKKESKNKSSEYKSNRVTLKITKEF